MEIRQLTCIGCPLGCPVTVEVEQGKAVKVTGYTCGRGKDYAQKEVENPVRTVTSTVRVEGGDKPFISVKTKEPVPKDRVFDCMIEIKEIAVKAPVKIGDIVSENTGGTGIPLLATKSAGRLQE